MNYYNKALNLMNEIEKADSLKITGKQYVINNIAIIYKEKKQYDKALAYLNESFINSLKSKDYTNAGNVCNNLGDLYQILNQPDSSLYYIKKGLDYRIKNNDKVGITRSYINLAHYNLRQNNLNVALLNAKKAIENLENMGDKTAACDAYRTLAEVEEKYGHLQEALNAYKQFKTNNDSLFNEQITREITKKEMEYEFEKRDRLQQLEQKEKEFKFITLAGILFTLFLVFSLLYFLSRSRNKRIELQSKNMILENKNLELEKQNLQLENQKLELGKQNLQLENQKLELGNQTLELEKEKLQQDLEFKNKELTTNIMYLLKKNELINDVTEQLLKQKKNLSKDNQDAFHNIIIHLQSGVDTNVWKEFEYRFQQVHSGFYDKLRDKFPDLTPSEIKLCAFLRLNLSSKEISAITHQNIRTLEIGRYRLRKKLNINNSDVNLVTFLMDF